MWVYFWHSERKQTEFRYPYQSGYTEIKQKNYAWDNPQFNDLLYGNGVAKGTKILEIWDSSNIIFQYIIVDYFGITSYLSGEGLSYIIKVAYEYHAASICGEWHIFFLADIVREVDIHN